MAKYPATDAWSLFCRVICREARKTWKNNLIGFSCESELPKTYFLHYISNEEDTVASTASVATLAIFYVFRSLPRKRKNACWDIPNPYEKTEVAAIANRKRPIVLRCPVTAEERKLIEQKMAQLPTQRIGAYLRKMAIDGYIINMDTTDIKAFTAELGAIGRNINQIAKRINAGGSVYEADLQEIRERLDEIWQLQRRILSNQL